MLITNLSNFRALWLRQTSPTCRTPKTHIESLVWVQGMKSVIINSYNEDPLKISCKNTQPMPNSSRATTTKRCRSMWTMIK